MTFFKICKRKLKKFLITFINKRNFFKSSKNLKKLKNSYNGKRCFIIGNGPSLTVSDVELLQNEITIGSHGIYYMFDKTNWRPTYYCVQDSILMNERISEIYEKCKDIPKVFGLVQDYKYPLLKKDVIAIRLILENFEKTPKFSTNALDGFYEGMTVTYFNIQFAVYMGFKEIYLLGVDHFYSGDKNDHFSENDVCTNKPRTDLSTYAYLSAKKFADENGIKIYNATRGGKLEVFERVNFEDLL